MVKISQIVDGSGISVVRIEGQVTGVWVAEVERYCRQLLEQSLPLTMDVADVSFLDRSGVRLFKDLLTSQATLLNCSPFLTELLRSEES